MFSKISGTKCSYGLEHKRARKHCPWKRQWCCLLQNFNKLLAFEWKSLFYFLQWSLLILRAKHWSLTQLSYNKDMNQCIPWENVTRIFLRRKEMGEHENKESEKKKLYKTFFGISFTFSNEDNGKRWQCANGWATTPNNVENCTVLYHQYW